jgi:hypothetical protein
MKTARAALSASEIEFPWGQDPMVCQLVTRPFPFHVHPPSDRTDGRWSCVRNDQVLE